VIEDTLVPQVAPETVTVAVAIAIVAVATFGVKPAVAVNVAPGAREPLLGTPVSENCGSDGVPSVTVAGPFPVLTSVSAMGVAVAPPPVDGNAAVVGDEGAKVIVAPLGVTDSGRDTFACAGSFVKRFNEPVSAIPTIAEPGTVPVITRAPEPPAATLRLLGLTEKADPVVAAVTDSAAVPPLLMENIDVTAAPPQPAGPRAMPPDAKVADATPASTLGFAVASSASLPPSSSAASVGSTSLATSEASVEASTIGLPVDRLDSLSVSSPPPQPATMLAQAIPIAHDRRITASRALAPVPASRRAI
jgi:hypothetical protein